MGFSTRAAVVRRAGGIFEFEDVLIDDLQPDEVLVRMVACGICHTDIAARDGLFGSSFPAVFGHEGAGVVVKVGERVVRVRPGDRVVLSFNSCGECPGCLKGHPARCRNFGGLNFGDARTDGSPTIRDSKRNPIGGCFFGQSSFSFHALARERSPVVVDAADDDELALFSPLGCGVQAGAGTVLNELKPRPNQSVVIFGAGTVGLSALMAARIAGAAPIIAVDTVPSRLEMAAELGASLVIDARSQDIAARLGDIFGQVDHAVETTGNSWIIDQAISSLGPRGKVSMLGVSSGDADESTRPGPRQTVFYSIAGDSNPQSFIPFMIRCYREGKFPFDRLIREYPAAAINEAVKDSLEGRTIKPVLRF